MKLSAAVRALGWRLVVCRRPGQHRDRQGKPGPHCKAVALTRGRVACLADDWEHAYSVSHEIAEAMHSFKDHEMVFCEQANILAAWHMLRSRQSHGLADLVKSVCRRHNKGGSETGGRNGRAKARPRER